jgi:serine/threonine protein phosphatase 1
MTGRTIAIDDIRPRTEDTVVTLGGYINRGADGRGALDRLIDLGRRCRLNPILGQMLLALIWATRSASTPSATAAAG